MSTSTSRILVCTLLLAVAARTAATAVADHGWPSNQSSSCGRSGGYSSNSNLGYRPLASSNGYSNNYGYGVRSTPQNYSHNSQGINGRAGFGNGNYDQYQTYSLRPGNNSYGYQNSGRNGNMVYDSGHGDYHTVPGSVSRPYQGNVPGGSRNQYQNDSPWFGGNSGW